MWKRGGYGRDFSHRLGRYSALLNKKDNCKRVWIQAVSVGEFLAVKPVVDRLSVLPGVEVVLSTTTSTAYALMRKETWPGSVFVCLFPLDFWCFSARAWRSIDADVVLLMEGELWPEHLHQARRRGVPAFLINGRLSDRSWRRYQRFPKLAAALWGQLQAIWASSEAEAKRFASLVDGATPVGVMGNLKFDVPVGKLLTAEQRREARLSLGVADSTWVVLGSSTWPGEEQALLEALSLWRSEGLAVSLLLVPRHAERRGELRVLLGEYPFSFHFRSEGELEGLVDVYVADTTGELAALTQLADVAVVGKSFWPNEGGQTPLEAAAWGLPLICGPRMTNFKAIMDSLSAADAVLCAQGLEDVSPMVAALLRDEQRCSDLGQRAQLWHASHVGAGDRVMEILAPCL